MRDEAVVESRCSAFEAADPFCFHFNSLSTLLLVIICPLPRGISFSLFGTF